VCVTLSAFHVGGKALDIYTMPQYALITANFRSNNSFEILGWDRICNK